MTSVVDDGYPVAVEQYNFADTMKELREGSDGDISEEKIRGAIESVQKGLLEVEHATVAGVMEKL